VSKRLPVRLSQIGGVLGAAFGDVYGHLGARGSRGRVRRSSSTTARPQGTIRSTWRSAPVARAIDPPEGWHVQELPAGTFVTLLHVGPCDSIGAAYDTVTEWIGAHDLAAAGPPREVYLSEPETPPELVRTIVELPVTEVAAPVATG
jgi:hypothetical protein